MILGLGIFEDFVGGISAYQTNFARQLIRHGYDVTVMIPRTHRDLPAKRVSPEGITVYRYGYGGGILSKLWAQLTEGRALLKQILNTHPVDVINVHFALSAWGMMNLKAVQHIPKIMDFHGPWPLEWKTEKLDSQGQLKWRQKWINWLQECIEGAVVRRMDELIFMSHAFVPYVQKAYGVPQEKINVVPIGWDVDALRPVEQTPEQCRDLLKISQEETMLLCVRRLVRRTGVDMLLDAAASLVEKYPQLRVYIGGRGPELSNLQRQAQQLGIEQVVHFLGFIPDEQLGLYYRAADVSCVPTRSLEGFGTILLESLVQGTPVIATPVGGLQEVLAPLSPDLLTTSVSSQALAQKLDAWLMGDLILPDEHTCRDYMAQSFHWDALFPKIEQLFQKYKRPSEKYSGRDDNEEKSSK